MIPRFFSRILLTLTSTQAYWLYRNQSWLKTGLFLLAAYILFIAPLQFIWLQWRVVPEFKKIASESLTEVNNNFPDELQLHWDGQQLQLTPDQTLHIPYSTALQKREWQMSQYLVVLIPSDSDVSNQNQNDTLFLVSPTRLLVQSSSSQWNELPLLDVFGEKNWTMNKTNHQDLFVTWLNTFNQMIDSLPFFAALPLTLGLFVARAWTGLIDALIVYLLIKLNRMPWSFPQITKAIFNLCFAAEVVTQLAQIMYGTISLPLFSVSIWAGLVVILFQKRKITVQQI